MAKYTFGEIAINQMNNRRKLEEEQKQFNEKMAEETRQANLLTAFRNQQIEIDRQRNAIMEQNNANENAYRLNTLAETKRMNDIEAGTPKSLGGGVVYDPNTGKIKDYNPPAPRAPKYTKSYQPDPDRPGWEKEFLFDPETNNTVWTGGFRKTSGSGGSNGFGYSDKSKATIAKNLDRLKVFSDNLTKQAEEKEIVYTTVDNKGNTLETIMPKSEYRSKAQGLLKQTMAEAGVPMSGKVIYTIKKSIQNYDNLSADEKIKEVDDAVGDLVKNRIIDETQGELARQWIRVTTR